MRRLTDPLVNDPCALIAQAFSELYPGKEYMAIIVDDLRNPDYVQRPGDVVFREGMELMVLISGQIRVVDMAPIFAAALSRVAVGRILTLLLPGT